MEVSRTEWIVSLGTILCFAFNQSFGQEVAMVYEATPASVNLSGRIVDAESGESLPLVNVTLLPIELGTSSDEEGSFEFSDLRSGQYILITSYLGYQTRSDTLFIEDGLDVKIALHPTPLQAEQVVVTASRRAQSLALAPASVGVVTSQRIEAQNLQTFDQAFDDMTGVQVTRSSGANVQALSIRGASEVAGGGIGNRVLLLIDGRPSLSPESGGALWNLVPLQSIERIEVVKGAYSSLFGSSAMGGVINVITREPSTTPQTRVHFNYGVYGPAPAYTGYDQNGTFHAVELSHSGGSARWRYLFDAGKRSNDGHRAKSGFDLYNAFGKVQFKPNLKETVTLSANYNRIMNDAPATWLNFLRAYDVAEHRLDDYQDRQEYNVDLSYRYLKNARIKYTGRTYFYKNYSQFSFNDDPENISETNVNFGKQLVDASFVRTSRWGTAAQADVHADKHYLIFGMDTKLDWVDGQPDTVLYGQHQAFTGGIYAQDEITWNDRLITTIGLRYDYFQLRDAFTESNFSPKVSAVYHVNEVFSARMLFGQAFRNPSIAERFIKFEQGGGLRFVPNPDLRAERLTMSYEVGGMAQLSSLVSFEAAYFYNLYRDLISFQQVPDPNGALVYRVINLSKALMQGIELNTRWQIASKVRLHLGYTWLDARDRSDNRINDRLAYKARQMLTGSVSSDFGPLSIQFTGRYRSALEEVFIYPGSEPDAYSIINGKVNYRFADRYDVYFAIDNINDVQYEELERYRMPGRSFTLGVRASW